MTAADQPTTEPSAVERVLAYMNEWCVDFESVLSEIPEGRRAEHLAEIVALAQAAPAPQPAADTETEVQWGVRRPDSKYLDWDQEPTDSERRRIEARGDTVVKHYVTRTPWEKA